MMIQYIIIAIQIQGQVVENQMVRPLMVIPNKLLYHLVKYILHQNTHSITVLIYLKMMDRMNKQEEHWSKCMKKIYKV